MHRPMFLSKKKNTSVLSPLLSPATSAFTYNEIHLSKSTDATEQEKKYRSDFRLEIGIRMEQLCKSIVK